MLLHRPIHNYPHYTAASTETDDYIAVIFRDHVDIYKNNTRIYQERFREEKISGAVYMNYILYYTKVEDNSIYALDLQNGKECAIRFEEYENVTVLKYVSHTRQWLVIEATLTKDTIQQQQQERIMEYNRNHKDLIAFYQEHGIHYESEYENHINYLWREEDVKETFLYDWDSRRKLFRLPMPYLIDCAILDQNEIVLMGEGTDNRTYWEEDGDGEEEKFLSIIRYDLYGSDEANVVETDYLSIVSIYDKWDSHLDARVYSKGNMRFPIFNKYLYAWLISKSITSHGHFAIYYSKDIAGLIISNCRNGEVYRIFKLPFDPKEETQFYFNEKSNVLTVLDEGQIKRYYVYMDETELLTLLNSYYSKSEKSLERDGTFLSLLYKTIFLTKCLGENDMKYKYDVALSFAGEDREYVSNINSLLKQRSIKVFYDEDNMALLWGRDLPLTLDEIYRKDTKFCMVFCSKYYRDKKWPKVESSSYKAAQIESGRYDYILPVLMDDTEIPGILVTQGNLDSRKLAPEEIVDIFIDKLHHFDSNL